MPGTCGSIDPQVAERLDDVERERPSRRASEIRLAAIGILL